MPRKRWYSKAQWRVQPMPHAGVPAASLWWYCKTRDGEPSPDSQRVIDEYLRRRARAGPAAIGFPSMLENWLSELTTLQPPFDKTHAQRGGHYWTIPCYATYQRENPYTAMKWFREMEKVARKLFPDRVPASRKTTVLPAELIEAIRSEYRETGDAKAVAAKHGIPAYRVGQLCSAEKAAREAEREIAMQSDLQSAQVVAEDEDIF